MAKIKVVKVRGEKRPAKITKNRRNRSGRSQNLLDSERKRPTSRYRVKSGEKSANTQEYEKELIRNRLRKAGIDPQTVDVDGLYDPTLTYAENLTNRDGFGRYFKTRELALGKREEFYKRQKSLQEWSREEREPRAWKTDEARTHKKNIAISKLDARNEHTWRYDPGAFDIRTVDDRIAFRERKRLEAAAEERQRAALQWRQRETELHKKFGEGSIVTHVQLKESGYTENDINNMLYGGVVGSRFRRGTLPAKKTYIVI